MVRFCVLGSGSRGNATYVESQGQGLLIDAGFSGVEVERRLAAAGLAMDRVSAILVTHEHSDHIRGVGVLSRRYRLPVHVNRRTLEAAGRDLAGAHGIELFETGRDFEAAGMVIHPFSVSHDAADPVGFLVGSGKRLFGYCTDTGVVSKLIRFRLNGCQGLVLECNHDAEMLQNGPYPEQVKQRVRSRQGHLENLEAAKLLTSLLHQDLEQVVISHISETNNSPERVKAAIRRMFDGLPSSCRLPRITLARQDAPSPLFTLGGKAP